GRNVEQALMKTLVGIAQARGAGQLHGVYLPTHKNKMVENFYADQGFQRANRPSGPDGATWWDLDLSRYSTPNIHGTLEMRLDAGRFGQGGDRNYWRYPAQRRVGLV